MRFKFSIPEHEQLEGSRLLPYNREITANFVLPREETMESIDAIRNLA